MRYRVAALLLIISLFLYCASSLPTASAQDDEWPIGAEWVYSYLDTYENAVFEGNLYYACVGPSNWTIDYETYHVIAFRSSIQTNASGSLNDVTIGGRWIENQTEYYDYDTGELVSIVVDEMMNLSTSYRSDKGYLNYTEHNVTEYIPPGGTGFDPSYLDIGTVWFKNYTERYNSTINADGELTNESSIFTEQIKFTFKGYKDVTVPAGTYYCSVVEVKYSDGTGTEYWADSINGYAKITQFTDSGESVTISLLSYKEPGQSNQPMENLPLTPLSIGFFIYVGSSLAAAVAAAMILRKRKQPPVGNIIARQWPKS